MQADVNNKLSKLNTQIEALKERTYHVEKKMGKFATTVNKLLTNW